MMYKVFQNLPNFKGKLRIAKILFVNKSVERSFIIKYNLLITVPNLTENVSFELFVNGIYEHQIIDLICRDIPTNGIYVDVGANIGSIALVVAKLRPDVMVYAFEAAPSVYKYLELNKKNNKLDNLIVINKAIHIKDHAHLPFYSTITKNGKGSFAPVFTKDSIMVNTISLDTFFSINKITPSLIKIDVEGFELVILQSMEKFLKTNKSCNVIFEFVDWAESLANFHPGAAQAYLINLNYSLFNIKTKCKITTPFHHGDAMILALSSVYE